MSLTIQTREYSGVYGNNMLTDAIVGAKTLQDGLVSVAEDVKSDINLPIFNFEDGLIRERVATPTVGTNMIIGEHTISTKPFMVYVEYNPNAFVGTWQEGTLAANLIARGLPVEFEAYVVSQMFGKVASEFDELMWRGDVNNPSERLNRFNGFIKQLIDSSDTIRPNGQVALTAANIAAELEKVYTSLPDAIQLSTTCKIVMDLNTWNAYRKAQQNQAGKGIVFAQDGLREFNGIPISVNPFLPNNTIAAGQFDGDAMMSNSFLARNNAQDLNTVLVDKVSNASELWFIKMLGQAAVGVPKKKEMALYTTWTPEPVSV